MSSPKQAAINVSHLEGIRFRMKCPPDHFETGNKLNVFQLLSPSPVPPAPMTTIRIYSLLQKVVAAIFFISFEQVYPVESYPSIHFASNFHAIDIRR